MLSKYHTHTEKLYDDIIWSSMNLQNQDWLAGGFLNVFWTKHQRINSPKSKTCRTHMGILSHKSSEMEPETSDPQTRSRKITLHFQISWLWKGRLCNSCGSLRKIFSPTTYLSCDIHLLSWCLLFQKLRLTPTYNLDVWLCCDAENL